jgi:hypothetical protein
VGVGINWTSPDGMSFIIGISIPPIFIRGSLATGQVFIRTGFPLIAFIAFTIAYVAPAPLPED